MNLSSGRLLLALLCSAFVLTVPRAAAAQALPPCNQTLSVGANIASAVSSAVSGSTICLNSGNYGTVTLNNIARTGFVTLRSATGVGAQMSPQVTNTDFVKFLNMTLTGTTITACSSNIEVRNSSFTVSSGMQINNYYSSCNNYPLNIVVDGNTFGPVSSTLSEGRLDIRDKDGGQGDMGITVSNNLFDGQGRCMSDGVQLTGGPSGVTIGPGNIFRNIVQDSSSVHCDSVQIVSGGPNILITGNWFSNGSVVLQFHDYTAPGVRFTNNVITNMQQFWAYNTVTFSGFVFEHNTVYNLTDVFQLGRLSSSVTARSNIIMGTSKSPDTASCSGCTFGYNLGQTASQAVGTNQVVGTPTFVGGAPSSITTFAGWKLASGSLGKSNGHDGATEARSATLARRRRRLRRPRPMSA